MLTPLRARAEQLNPFLYERALRDHDVLVRVTHCSIARGDVQFIDNDWGDTRFPLVPGHEIVGLVEATGSTVTGLIAGDRVGIGYQQEACFTCEFCTGGNEQLCPQQKAIGVDCYGGLADYIGVDSRFAFALPPTLDSAKATPLLSAGLTVYSGIVRAELRDGSDVAVLGVGGLGSLAVQFLREMGHRVSAFSHSPAKKEMIERLGAEYIDSSHLAGVTTLRRRFDFILSTLNTGFDLNAYLGMLKPQGKLCVVAQPLEMLSISLGLLYDNALRTIYGNYVGSRPFDDGHVPRAHQYRLGVVGHDPGMPAQGGGQGEGSAVGDSECPRRLQDRSAKRGSVRANASEEISQGIHFHLE